MDSKHEKIMKIIQKIFFKYEKVSKIIIDLRYKRKNK